MKKLIGAVAVAMLGVAVQAATVNWSVNAIQSSPANTVGAGWIVQIFDSSVTYDYAKAIAGDLTTWTDGKSIAAGATYRATGSTTLENGTSKTVYAVVYDAARIEDAKYYIVSDVITLTATANGANVNAAFGAMTATTSANKFLNSSWTATAVPEPTSGLLMLLGMAGLALRRRRV